jgi:ABC-type Fe3+ transport system permease subunit
MSDSFGLWDVIVSTFWFMVLVAWIVLVFRVIADIFRDRDLSGGAKAFWCLFIIFVPWLGVLVYLIARGDSMNRRSIEAAQAQQQQFRSYVQETAGGASTADELGKLAQLRDSGTITPADYEQAKAKILA